MARFHSILVLFFLGMNANNITVSTAMMVIECPEGRLLFPARVFPIMVKLLQGNAAAGLGTANIFLSVQENSAQTSNEEIRHSQILGMYMIRIDSSDKNIDASPSCVRLYSMF